MEATFNFKVTVWLSLKVKNWKLSKNNLEEYSGPEKSNFMISRFSKGV